MKELNTTDCMDIIACTFKYNIGDELFYTIDVDSETFKIRKCFILGLYPATLVNDEDNIGDDNVYEIIFTDYLCINDMTEEVSLIKKHAFARRDELFKDQNDALFYCYEEIIARGPMEVTED